MSWKVKQLIEAAPPLVVSPNPSTSDSPHLLQLSVQYRVTHSPQLDSSMSLAWQDTPVFTQQSQVSSPAIQTYTQPQTRPSTGPGGAPRSRKPLPFPLPDPYADTGQFELYDPRGLNLKRRESTSSSTGASVGSKGGGHERESSAGSTSAGGSAILGVGLAMSPVEPTDMQEVLKDKLAPTPTAAASEASQVEERQGPETISIPIDPSPSTSAAPPSLAPSPMITSPRTAASRLNQLRIGSASSAQIDTARAAAVAEPPPSSPDYFATPLPSVPHHSHARQPTSESAFSSHLSESRSRASSSASAASSALSPAASFLSSFSGSRDASLSASGRFAALVDGDEEGFQVAGYILGKELGRGGFGIVREATKVSSLRGGGAGEQGEKVAVKIVRHRQPAATTPHVPVSTVGEALKRSVSGYRMPPHNRDRRMSLASEGQRIRSASTPVRRPDGEEETFTSVGTKATPAQIQALESTIAKLPGLKDANSPPSQGPSPFATASRHHQRDHSVDSVAEPPSLIQALLTREIHLWAQLSPHPHIVQLITSHQSEDFTYIFMPLCEGGNLLDFLNAGGVPAKKRRRLRGRGSSIGLIGGSLSLSSSISGPEGLEEEEPRKGLPLPLAREIFGQVVEGLHYLHTDVGVTHRDIKLDNILCDEKDAGATGTWKIADFGLAESASSGNMLEVAKGAAAAAGKSRSSSPTKPKRPRGPIALGASHGHITPGLPLASLSRANSLSRPDSCTSSSNDLPAFDSIDEHLHPAGSLPYSTPEQMRSPVPILEPSGDVWAAGCVLYAMVQGVLPFTDEFEPRLRSKILKGTWELPSNLLGPDGEPKGEEEARCLEVLKGCLEVNRKKRWTIKQVRESAWLRPPAPQPSPIITRGRELSRGRGAIPRHASASQGPSSRSGSDASTGGSTSGVRRKERSTSRNSAAVKHLGVDERTRSAERKGAEREERKMRWDRSRSRTAVRDSFGSTSASASATRTGSRSRNQRGVGAEGMGRGRADLQENRGRSRERGGVPGPGERDPFDLEGVRREAEKLGRVWDTEPY